MTPSGGAIPSEARTVTLQLPKPPSVNRLWRKNPHGGMYLDKGYMAWRNDAARMLLVQRRPRVNGRFTASIIVDAAGRRGDVDNRIKATLDVLQYCGVITNDSLCDRVTAEWGIAPTGCTVTLTEVAA